MRASASLVVGLSLLCVLSRCAPDLRDDFPFDGQLPDGVYLTLTVLGDATRSATIDATSKGGWVYVDLDASTALSAAEALSTKAWDIALQRFKVISNGGVSGDGPVAVARLPGQSFEALAAAPSGADPYVTDAPDGPDADTDVDSAFLADGAWYAYDLAQHRLVPRDVTFVVRTTEARFVKLRFDSYYDEVGTAARLSVRWADVTAP